MEIGGTAEQQAQIKQLVMQYSRIFQPMDKDTRWTTQPYKLKVDLDRMPISNFRAPKRVMSQAVFDATAQQIKLLQDMGFVEPAKPYMHPVTGAQLTIQNPVNAVKQSVSDTGELTVRLTIDMSRINQYLFNEPLEMPDMKAIQEQMAAAKFTAVMDMSKMFFQQSRTWMIYTREQATSNPSSQPWNPRSSHCRSSTRDSIQPKPRSTCRRSRCWVARYAMAK